jgi:hypothetical protein
VDRSEAESDGDTEFTLVMKPVPGKRMSTDACGGFTLDSYGRRGVTREGAGTYSCWR